MNLPHSLLISSYNERLSLLAFILRLKIRIFHEGGMSITPTKVGEQPQQLGTSTLVDFLGGRRKEKRLWRHLEWIFASKGRPRGSGFPSGSILDGNKTFGSRRRFFSCSATIRRCFIPSEWVPDKKRFRPCSEQIAGKGIEGRNSVAK